MPVITAIDIGFSMIKVVQLSAAGGRIRLHNVGCAEIRGGEKTAEEASKALSELLAAMGGARGRVICAVPRQQASVRNLTLPTLDAGELREMVRFEAERQLPFSLEDIEVAYHVLSRQENSSEVMLVAVQKEILERQVALLSGAGVVPDSMDVTSFALNNFLSFTGQIEHEKTVAIADVGARNTEFSVVKGRKVWFTRSAPVGSDLYSEIIAQKEGLTVAEVEAGRREGKYGLEAEGADMWLARLAGEFRRSFDAAKLECHGAAVEELMLSGGGAGLKKLDSALEKRLDIPVKTIDCLSSVKNPGMRVRTPGDGKRVLFSDVSTMFAMGMGLALREDVPDSASVNLIPTRIVEEKRRRKARLKRVGIIAAAGIAVIAVCGSAVLKVYLQSRTLAGLEAQAADLESATKRQQTLEERLALFEGYTEDKASCLEVLRVLSIVSPPNVHLTSLAFERARKLDINGRATSESAVYIFVSAMQKSGYFEEVKSTRISKAEQDMVDFGISCVIVTGETGKKS